MSESPRIADLRVAIDYDSYVFYANALNGSPVFRDVQLSISSAKVLQDIMLEIEVTSLGQPMSHPFLKRIARLDSEVNFSSPVDIHWNAANLWNLTEAQPGEVTLRIHQDEVLLHEQVFPIEVASPSHWKSNHAYATQTLAAFVQPNHPSLKVVLDKAAALLESRNLPAKFSGYQDMPFVEHMVQALWDATQSLGIRYSNPPASWDLPGQKIRNAQQVIVDKLGTCLDTSVLFASLLENVGLAPVIALAPGHAWVGYWMLDPERDEMPNKEPVASIKDIVLYADLEHPQLVFLESTALCPGDQPMSFADAAKAGLRDVADTNSLGAASGYSAIVDVLVARDHRSLHKIIPMPARVTNEDGTIEIFEYKPADFSYNILLDKLSIELKDKGKTANLIDMQVPPRLRRWLDSLLDLSLRNPLINFRNPTSSVQLVMAPDTVAPLEDMLSAGASLEIISYREDPNSGGSIDNANDRGQIAAADLELEVAKALQNRRVLTRFSLEESVKRLRRMSSSAKTLLEETGSNGLYLALGELVWIPEGKLEVRSPLLLVPVTLIPKNRSQSFFLTLDESSQVTPNFSLVQLFKRETGVDLNMLTELVEDESGIDVRATLNAVRDSIAQAKLQGIRVDETATLGFFNFSSYRLWRDLVENWKVFEQNPLVKHLIYSPNLPFEDPATSDQETNLDSLVAELPIEADSSQALAVSEALKGKTFVLQGPPGTGKSQTITNLLARSLQEGKRVLFVAEKKEALDVVKNRLEAVGLGDFSLDLHDKGMSPKHVKAQLSAAVNKAIEADQVGFQSALASYSQSAAPLVDYRTKLHDESILGDSLYSAIDRFLATPGDAELPVTGEFISKLDEVTKAEMFEVVDTISRIGVGAGNAKTNDWFLSNLEMQTVESQQAITVAASTLLDVFTSIKKDPGLFEYLESVSSVEEFKTSIILAEPGVSQLDASQSLGESPKAQRLQLISELEKLIAALNFFDADLRNLKLLDPDQEVIENAEAVSSSFVTRGFKQKKIQARINATLGAQIAPTPETLAVVLSKFQEIKALERAALETLNSSVGIQKPSDATLCATGIAQSLLEDLRRLDKLVEFISLRPDGAVTTSSLVAIAKDGQRISLWSRFVSQVLSFFETIKSDELSLALWLHAEPFGKRLSSSIDFWGADAKDHSLVQLGRVCALNIEFSKLRMRGLEPLVAELASGDVPFEQAYTAYSKGFYRALASNIMVMQGFNTFDNASNANFLGKLKDSKTNLQSLLPAVLGASLESRRGFDTKLKVGAVGDLILSLNSKRGTSIRTMLSRHWDVITKISPCVLASPDSTVRFIAADLAPFDLVVFDEASQIRVANSIGSIGRAKAAIIVGDSKQMPPTSVAQVRTDVPEDQDVDYEEELTGVDAESILDQCAIARVPDILLNWHYRSEDESLITFSNTRYYESRLNTFPNPSTERATKGLRFVHVADGQFIRPGDKLAGAVGTNPQEAAAIVAEVSRRANDPELKKDSLGIVTFNKQQQALIEEMLLNSKDKGIQEALEDGLGGEEILIKNLETVQGSERDVVIFSVAFSKRPKGKELPLSFGPLNYQGGERRLNVAITRAKRQVLVYCSFRAQDLKARKPDSVGVAHLAEYLTIAENQSAIDFLNVTSAADVDRHRGRVLKALVGAGLNATQDMGLSGFKVDIAIFDERDSSKAVLGILLDGPRWNSRQTVNDRDLLPVSVLQGKMGWPMIERVWLPSWIRDEFGEVERIKKAVEAAKIEASKPRIRPEKPGLKSKRADDVTTSITQVPSAAGEETSSVIEHNSTVSSAGETAEEISPAASRPAKSRSAGEDDPYAEFVKSLPIFAPAAQVRAGQQQDLEFLFDPKVQNSIRKVVASLTKDEGPVSQQRLTSYIGASFGFEKVLAKRVQEILAVGLPKHQVDEDGFVFPVDTNPEDYKQFAIGGGRRLDDVSQIELANLMCAICDYTKGCREEQLIKMVSELYGMKVLTPAASERLAFAVQTAVDLDRLAQEGDYLVASGN